MVTFGPACFGAPPNGSTARRGKERTAVRTPPATAATASTPRATKGQRAGGRRARGFPFATAGRRSGRRRFRFVTGNRLGHDSSGAGARHALLLRAAGRRVVEVLAMDVRVVGGACGTG